jgi:hypothetical protein
MRQIHGNFVTRQPFFPRGLRSNEHHVAERLCALEAG